MIGESESGPRVTLTLMKAEKTKKLTVFVVDNCIVQHQGSPFVETVLDWSNCRSCCSPDWRSALQHRHGPVVLVAVGVKHCRGSTMNHHWTKWSKWLNQTTIVGRFAPWETSTHCASCFAMELLVVGIADALIPHRLADAAVLVVEGSAVEE